MIPEIHLHSNVIRGKWSDIGSARLATVNADVYFSGIGNKPFPARFIIDSAASSVICSRKISKAFESYNSRRGRKPDRLEGAVTTLAGPVKTDRYMISKLVLHDQINESQKIEIRTGKEYGTLPMVHFLEPSAELLKREKQITKEFKQKDRPERNTIPKQKVGQTRFSLQEIDIYDLDILGLDVLTKLGVLLVPNHSKAPILVRNPKAIRAMADFADKLFTKKRSKRR